MLTYIIIKINEISNDYLLPQGQSRLVKMFFVKVSTQNRINTCSYRDLNDDE